MTDIWYEWETFKAQMAEATELLKKMNEAATYMRWQRGKDAEFLEFEAEMSEATEGWLASWCG